MSFASLRRSRCAATPSVKEIPKMRKVVAVTQMTLDGVMQAPGGPKEDPGGGFGQGGWSVGYWDEVLEEASPRSRLIGAALPNSRRDDRPEHPKMPDLGDEE
jgi:hypothetical protein